MQATWIENGAEFKTDGTATEMVMTLFSRSIYTPNSRKRMNRVERLARDIGFQVAYPMNDEKAGIHVYNADEGYECISYRQTERLLRELKRTR
jgi:hypothetical protein